MHLRSGPSNTARLQISKVYEVNVHATDDDVILMMEVDEESTHVPSHKQRTAMFLSAMRHFAVDRAEAGARVRYVSLTDGHNTHSFEGEIARAADACRPNSIHVAHPGDWRVMKKLEALEDDLSGSLAESIEIHEDEHFLTPLDTFREWAEGRKQWTMEYFYREQRRRLGVDDRRRVAGPLLRSCNAKHHFAGVVFARFAHHPSAQLFVERDADCEAGGGGAQRLPPRRRVLFHF